MTSPFTFYYLKTSPASSHFFITWPEVIVSTVNKKNDGLKRRFCFPYQYTVIDCKMNFIYDTVIGSCPIGCPFHIFQNIGYRPYSCMKQPTTTIWFVAGLFSVNGINVMFLLTLYSRSKCIFYFETTFCADSTS